MQYELSARGDQRYKELGDEFDNLLRLQAVALARRRGSKTADESDFEQAYRELTGGRQVDFARQLFSAVLYVVAGGGASWAVNAYTSADVPDGQGHWAAVAMLVCGALAVFICRQPLIAMACNDNVVRSFPGPPRLFRRLYRLHDRT